MPKEEIISGLQNAIARGQSLEQAAQSFINAGYNPIEVKAAASIVSSGVSDFTQSDYSPSSQQQQPQSTQNQQSPSVPSPITSPKKQTGKGKIIALAIILILLLLALTITIFFKDQFLSLF
jgi:hypothetical protein